MAPDLRFACKLRKQHEDMQKTLLLSLRVYVPNTHILTQNLYYTYYYPKPKYLIIGYMDS